MLHVSGTLHHVIVIYGTQEKNDIISRWYFYFFKILIFELSGGGGGGGGGRGVKMQKMVQKEKKVCASCSIFQETCMV